MLLQYICTGDNVVEEVRGLSSRTNHTITYTRITHFCILHTTLMLIVMYRHITKIMRNLYESFIILWGLFLRPSIMQIAINVHTYIPSIHVGFVARNYGFVTCKQRRRRPACALAQSDQRLCA